MRNQATRSDFHSEEQRLDDGCVVVTVQGVVDLFAAPEFKRRLEAAVELGARRLVVDLAGTTFLDSTGLGALLTTHRRQTARGGELVIVLGGSVLTRLFEVTGLDAILAIAPTRELALLGV